MQGPFTASKQFLDAGAAKIWKNDYPTPLWRFFVREDHT